MHCVLDDQTSSKDTTHEKVQMENQTNAWEAELRVKNKLKQTAENQIHLSWINTETEN